MSTSYALWDDQIWLSTLWGDGIWGGTPAGSEEQESILWGPRVWHADLWASGIWPTTSSTSLPGEEQESILWGTRVWHADLWASGIWSTHVYVPPPIEPDPDPEPEQAPFGEEYLCRPKYPYPYVRSRKPVGRVKIPLPGAIDSSLPQPRRTSYPDYDI